MKTLLTISKLTFREAARRKILWAALILGLLFLIVFDLGYYFINQDIQQNMSTPNQLMLNEVYSFFFMAGMYAVNFLTIGMSVLTSVDTLSGEITTGTMQTLVTKPVRRSHILLGKWLGFVGMLTLYLILMAGGIIGSVFVISGYLPSNALAGLALIWLNGLLMLSLSFWGAPISPPWQMGSWRLDCSGLLLWAAGSNMLAGSLKIRSRSILGSSPA